MKRAIAKEVIILFSSIIVLMVIWSFSWIKNERIKSKAQIGTVINGHVIPPPPDGDSRSSDAVYSDKDLQKYFWKLALYIFVIVYPLRFTFYLLRWSIQILKQPKTHIK